VKYVHQVGEVSRELHLVKEWFGIGQKVCSQHVNSPSFLTRVVSTRAWLFPLQSV
jgi:hypothetical protein